MAEENETRREERRLPGFDRELGLSGIGQRVLGILIGLAVIVLIVLLGRQIGTTFREQLAGRVGVPLTASPTPIPTPAGPEEAVGVMIPTPTPMFVVPTVTVGVQGGVTMGEIPAAGSGLLYLLIPTLGLGIYFLRQR